MFFRLLKFLNNCIFKESPSSKSSLFLYVSYFSKNSSGLAFLNLYILCFTSPTINILFPLDIDVSIVSCTRLLSWYSSIIISSYFSLYLSDTLLSSFVKISNAVCAISSKYIMFLSCFTFVNFSINSNVIFFILINISYICFVS